MKKKSQLRPSRKRTLPKSDERLSAVLSGITDGIVVLDREFRTTFMNEAARERLRRLGFKAGDFAGRVLWDVPSVRSDSDTANQLREVMRTRASRTIEATLREQHFELRCFPARDGGLIVLCVDVTLRKKATLDLALRETKFALAFEMAPYALALARLEDGVLVDVNPAWSRLYGIPRHEAVGKTSTDLGIYRDPGEGHRLTASRLSGQIRDLETTVVTRAGSVRTVSVNLDFIEIASQPHVLATVEDITARRAAEAQIAASERKLSTMFAAAPFAISLAEMSSGVISDVNPAWVKLFGFPRDEAIGKTTVELGIHPDLDVREQLRQHIAQDGSMRDAELTLRTRTGALIVVSNNFDLIELEGQKYVLSTLRDVTAQRAAERALAEREQHFRFLADNLPEIVWTARPDGTVDYRNVRWYEFTGLPHGSAGSEYSRPFVHPEDLPRATKIWQQSLRTGEPYQVEARYLDRKSGSYRWFLVRAAPLRDDEGRITRWFGTLTDIQVQREAAEKLGEALQLREDFLAIAGHELKTPLAALLMHVQSLQRAAEKGDGAVQVKERLAKASRASWRLDKLINELLDVSRITAGRLQLDVEQLDLVALVHDVAAAFKERTNADIVVRASEPSIPGAYDRMRVEQVVGNLIENALKYGEGRPVEIEVARDGAEAVVRVIDHGIGIDDEQQKRIFQRFERAVTARDFGGLGLGLWISRQIVEASGGRVDVDSEPGEGSTFTVRLPLLH